MDMVTGACSSCEGLWGRGMWCYGRGYCGWWVEVVPVVGPVEDVGWLDRVG
jgi:hypothetical protein